MKHVSEINIFLEWPLEQLIARGKHLSDERNKLVRMYVAIASRPQEKEQIRYLLDHIDNQLEKIMQAIDKLS